MNNTKRSDKRSSNRKQLDSLMKRRNELLLKVNDASDDDIHKYRVLIEKCVHEKRVPGSDEIAPYKAIFELDMVENMIRRLMPFKDKIRLLNEYSNLKK